MGTRAACRGVSAPPERPAHDAGEKLQPASAQHAAAAAEHLSECARSAWWEQNVYVRRRARDSALKGVKFAVCGCAERGRVPWSRLADAEDVVPAILRQ